MNNVYARIKRRKDWGIDPEFVQLNPSMNSWLSDLPADLSVTFPPDGSPPWLPNHFIGNLHSYYYLAVLMLHRPQLNFLDPNGQDGQWKSHMVLCLSSAKLLCRLQEAMLQSFGSSGLQCMQRGISFTIYAVLTCIPLYLVRSLIARSQLCYTDIFLGCLDVSRPGPELGCQGLLHAPYAYPGENYGILANAGDG
jgi:hypothetical protein